VSLERLRRLAAALDRPGEDPVVDALSRYLDELERWNRGANLVSRRQDRAGLRRMVRNALALAACLPASVDRGLEIGSGAGLPGVVVALVRPDLELHLVERRRRRAAFLGHLQDALPLPSVKVHSGDAVRLMERPGWRGGFDLVLLQALTVPEVAMAAARPFLAASGRVVMAGGEGLAGRLGLVGRSARGLIPGASGQIVVAHAGGDKGWRAASMTYDGDDEHDGF